MRGRGTQQGRDVFNDVGGQLFADSANPTPSWTATIG